MFGFQAAHLVNEDRYMRVWRESGLLCVRLFGVIDDERSFEWRRAVDLEVEQHGFPRFVAFEMSEMESSGSLINRAAVASYARDLMKNVEWAVLHTRMRPATTLVVRIVMIASRVRNVTLTSTDEQFKKALQCMRTGAHP